MKNILRTISIVYLIFSIILVIIILPVMFLNSKTIFIKNFNWYSSHILIEIILALNLYVSIIFLDKEKSFYDIKILILVTLLISVLITALIGSFSDGFKSKYYYFSSEDEKYRVILEEREYTIVAYKIRNGIVTKIGNIYRAPETYYIIKNNCYEIEWNDSIMKFYYTFDKTKSMQKEKMYCKEINAE